MNKKYFAIHAHFYQPPRENPWTGEIEQQDWAFPYENFNHRIFMESYLPNLYGRIKNYKNEVLEIINNYAFINFNFGPTLLGWMEKEYPDYYNQLIETVKKTKSEKGFSNAIAQCYNHTILPLDDFNNKSTGIYWGIRDFEKRFGFYPAGIWLAETAVNEDTLKILIDYKIKYIVLAPTQIKNIKNIKTGKEKKENLDSSPCIFYDKDISGNKIKERNIIIFPYNGELSRKTAFENITDNSSIFANTIDALYEKDSKENQFFLLALDGETFGHHHKFADMTLSHCLKYEFEKKNIKIVTLEEYLQLFEPQYECDIEPGIDAEGTSWSCSHGIRRWKGGCPCGDEGVYNTSWRFPLRNSANWLKEVANDLYKEEGSKIFHDIWKARNEYIDYIFERNIQSLENFFNNNLKQPQNDEDRQKALRLLEMQKYSIFAFTSCAWFFNDISRIEAQQNMKYALRAIEIAESFGFKGISRVYASILEMGTSNFKEMANGRVIFENHIFPLKISPGKIASYLAIRSYINLKSVNKNFRYEIKMHSIKEEASGLLMSFELLDYETRGIEKYHLDIDFFENSLPKFKIKNETTQETEEIDIISYPAQIQKELVGWAICRLKKKNIDKVENLFFIYSQIIEKNQNILSYNFDGIKEELSFLFLQIMKIKVKLFLREPNKETFDNLETFLNSAKRLKIETRMRLSFDIMSLIPVFQSRIKNLDENLLEKAITAFSAIGLNDAAFHIENYIQSKTKSAPVTTSAL